MAVPNKIKKFFGKCKKPFICISKITKISKKNKKETITPSTIITNTTNPKFSPVTPSFVHPVAIKLNVGGITYMTTQQTLCTYPSYLSELFFIFRSPNLPPSSAHPQYPWPEELFIDRDGELFNYILSFLRTGTLPNSIPLSILQKLDYEASFYGIKPLQTLISHRVKIHTTSPKYKVIPIERLSNDEPDFVDGEEIVTSNVIGIRRSNSSSYSISSLHQRNRFNSDNISLNSNSSGDSSEIVPIIYNPCNTTTTSASRTPTTSYTPITRTPKSSTSTQNNFYVSSAASQNCDYKPEYEIISITKIPIILKDNNYTFDNFDKMNYLYDEEFHTKELATFVVLQRKDE
ncbi:4772_t:CDS:2 [Rhizophagus irregularis]|nr:4772_t:CDS:2 [Rhizophagus irregularis]